MFDDDDLAFAEDLALRAATAVQNARLYAAQERDRAHAAGEPAARSACPSCPGWETHAAYQAGERGADVGGDFYDVLPVDAGHLVVLGDVTGKGIEAAALTSLVRHSARMAARFDPRPARVLALVNQVLREQPRLSLVTVVCALVETDGDQARGHRRLGRAPAAAAAPRRARRRRRSATTACCSASAGEEDWSRDAGAARPPATPCSSTPTA